MSVDWGAETLTWRFRFAASREDWMFFMALTRSKAAARFRFRTSLPTAMVVMLVDGMNVATLTLTQSAAAEMDVPSWGISSFWTLTMTSTPVPESAVNSWWSALERRTWRIPCRLMSETMADAGGGLTDPPPILNPTNDPGSLTN